MIDVKARQEARVISRGADPTENTAAKVAFYGLLSRALRPELLPASLMLKQEPLKQDRRESSFNSLRNALSTVLIQAANDGHKRLGEDVKALTRQSFKDYSPDSPLCRMPGAVLLRLQGGCYTAAFAETVTLRTISKRQSEGQKISLEGLLASARVPNTIAMLHLLDLTAVSEAPKAIDTFYGHWDAPNTQDSGYIFTEADASLDPVTGLNLINTHRDLVTEEARRDRGPHIGCPAKLIAGYINKVHAIASYAALEAGLIEVS